jgi:hypothetical protein
VRRPRDGEASVRFLQALLALWAAGAVGMLLVVLWTSGFLPEFLQPASATVLLAKPVPRWSLLAGKYLGVLAFVAFQVTVFVAGTWAALGLATGFWPLGYLFSIPLLVLEFAILYSFSALLAVWTRSTVACIFGTLLFWGLCAGVNHARRQAVTPSPALEASYWVLPKPTDLVLLLGDALGGGAHFRTPGVAPGERPSRGIEVELSLLSSLLFTGAVLGLAARRFVKSDY